MKEDLSPGMVALYEHALGKQRTGWPQAYYRMTVPRLANGWPPAPMPAAASEKPWLP